MVDKIQTYSLFQTYVMNFVENVIDYYLHIISPHMYLMVLLVAHTTQVIFC